MFEFTLGPRKSWLLGVGLEHYYVMLVMGPCFAAVRRADLGILMPAALWPCCKAACGCPPLPRGQPDDYKWRWEQRQGRAGSRGGCGCVVGGGHSKLTKKLRCFDRSTMPAFFFFCLLLFCFIVVFSVLSKLLQNVCTAEPDQSPSSHLSGPTCQSNPPSP